MLQRAVARVNLAAIERNVARMRAGLSRGAQLCAVVKADGYGHGAAQAGRAALRAGATWLAVATADEALGLRADGIDAPVLIMGAISADELPGALQARADLVAWSERFVSDVSRAVDALESAGSKVGLHVKLDTGMGRLGTRHLSEALGVAERAAAGSPGVRLAGAMTHFATADEDDPEFLHVQLERFAPFAAEMRGRWNGVLVHGANSAATLRERSSHYDLVRCGISIYGCDPMNIEPAHHDLEPALELGSYVAVVKEALPGDSVGYGRRYVAAAPTHIGTLPIGYGDGLRRALSDNCEVIIDGRRYPVVGTISMDNITVDLGPDSTVRPGAQATIIGSDGDERQTAEDLARRAETLNYEIVCGLSARVPRVYHRDGEAVA